ncbi:MAG: hypothetical protein WBN10_03145 [Polyangiales bacterium]|jgi:hypothetical protein
MRTTIGEIEVPVALLEQAREAVCERSNVCRHFLRSLTYKVEKLPERVFDRS